MLAHGTHTIAMPRRVQCGSSSFDLTRGATFEVLQTDQANHKQLAKFGERDVDWFYEGDLEDIAGVDYYAVAGPQ